MYNQNLAFQDHNTLWYREDAISKQLICYLKENGYTILKDTSTEKRGEDIIALSPQGFKEIIEVKGYPAEFSTKDLKEDLLKKSDVKQQAKHWFSEALFSTFINYGRHYLNGKIVLALGLPETERYRNIADNLTKYFTANNLNLKIYFVSENGDVNTVFLNDRLNHVEEEAISIAEESE